MKTRIAAFLLTGLISTLGCYGQEPAVEPKLEFPGSGPEFNTTITKVTGVSLGGATAGFSGTTMTVDNMHIASATTKGTDFVRGIFKFSSSTLNFAPSSFQDYPGVGTYSSTSGGDYFASDSYYPVTFKDKSNNVLNEYVGYSATTTNGLYTADLHTGQVISMDVYDISSDLHLVVTRPDGTIGLNEYFQVNSNVITSPIPILVTGRYTFNFTRVGTDAVTFDFGFSNANRQKLTTVTDGTYLSTDLRTSVRDFYKYQVHIPAGYKVELDAPYNSSTQMTLVTNAGGVVQADIGLGLVYVAPTTVDDYIFIDDYRAQGDNYSGYIHVSKASASEVEQALAGPQAGGRRNSGKPGSRFGY